MIQCAKCGNDTRTSGLVTASGPVMLAGTLALDPQPISAQVCASCGYIELYGPQPIVDFSVAVPQQAVEGAVLAPVAAAST